MKLTNLLTTSIALSGIVVCTSCCALLATGSTSSGSVYTSDGYDYGYGYGTGYTYGNHEGSYGYSNYATPRAFSYDQARQQALFLSDKMAYELGLTDAQYAAVYEINLDYLMSIDNPDNLYSSYWSRRNSDLFYVLDPRQYNDFISADYFYRPLYYYNNTWTWRIYTRYDNPRYFYRQRPNVYDSYHGGHNRPENSYYAGRFGVRNGQPPVVNNHNNGPRPSGTGNNNHVTPQQGNNQHGSFGNGTRQPTSTTTNPRPNNPNIVQPQNRPQTQPSRPAITRPQTSTPAQKIQTPVSTERTSPAFGGSSVNRQTEVRPQNTPQRSVNTNTPSTSGNSSAHFGGHR